MSPSPRKTVVRLALAQLWVEPGDPAGNLRRATDAVRNASTAGAQVVLLPEALDFGWTHPSACSGAGTIPGGESFERLSAAAATEGIHVCAGVVGPEGELACGGFGDSAEPMMLVDLPWVEEPQFTVGT